MESEIEKAKRWLLGDYNDLEKLKIDLDLKSLLEEFEKESNTIEVRRGIESKINSQLEKLQYENKINDYLVEDVSDSEEKKFIVNLKQSPATEVIKIDVSII